ncbi:MAG: phenylalanine--tRNA ligase subunit beta [Kiritimatiellae bacterium]|nr:phenylalanine--tRNA ligase subunit beta [Kiritimatiellia bacterium]MDD5519971.1 phenylalanine--tRNA ligase subunit beta [Kiritimatiellia bacterium]
MKVPVSWLKEYVDFDASPEELAKKLTFSGTEVESIQTIGGDFKGVVVGEVRSIEKHPGADNLLVCKVNSGREEVSVVCGAHNFNVGDKAPLALVGAELPNGMKIEERKVRGVISMGMLCAEDELGLSDDHSGIMLVSRNIPAGTPFSEVAGPPETVLSVEITWNRPDCLSIIGMAREVAALFRTSIKLPSVDFMERGEPVEMLADVDLQDVEGCPRYTARVLTDIKLKPSPSWMQKRLTLCGVRPINNVVDITNYVLLECGQPLHAFDYELLTDHKIIVRRGHTGEKMTTLDGIERQGLEKSVLITDPARAVALAGVMGGAGSEINDNTRNVLLESAFFHPPDIRRTSSKLGLSTESSYRFERGVDIGGVEWASRRATALMVEHADAVAAQGVIDVYPNKRPEKKIKCRFQSVKNLLGVDVADEEIVNIIKSLEFSITGCKKDHCVVGVPTFRPDIEIEADLIEEVARIHGLDKVPTIVPQARVVVDADDSVTRATIACRSNLIGLGLMEIMNYSFLSEQLLNAISSADIDSRVVLPNPVSSDYAVMRNSLIPQMVDTLGRNLAHQVDSVSLFEIGKVFLKDNNNKISEENHLCIGLMGKSGRAGLNKCKPVEREEIFLWLKGVIEALAVSQHVGNLVFKPLNCSRMDADGAVSIEMNGHVCGVMGLVKQEIRKKWRMIEPVAVAEMNMVALIQWIFTPFELHSIPVYPSVSRDVAMVVDENVRHDDILKIIKKAAPQELTGIELFDIFRSEHIGACKKSMAYSLVYRSLERTLTDEDANRYHEIIKEALRKELKAEIREGK